MDTKNKNVLRIIDDPKKESEEIYFFSQDYLSMVEKCDYILRGQWKKVYVTVSEEFREVRRENRK